MALDDLDLEFEDEEEAKRRKDKEQLHQDVDLEFSVPESVSRAKHRPASAGGPPRPPGSNGPNPNIQVEGALGAEVRNIQQARANATAQIKRPVPGAPPGHRPGVDATVPKLAGQVAGANALKNGPMALPSDFDDVESAEILELREKVRKTEFDSEVKVQVAEFKAEFIGEMLGDMKLMEHQINQLLVRINAKHPDIKQEALMIKKILADYTTKKRK